MKQWQRHKQHFWWQRGGAELAQGSLEGSLSVRRLLVPSWKASLNAGMSNDIYISQHGSDPCYAVQPRL